MKSINIKTISKAKTKKNICWDVLIDYTHFLYACQSYILIIDTLDVLEQV